MGSPRSSRLSTRIVALVGSLRGAERFRSACRYDPPALHLDTTWPAHRYARTMLEPGKKRRRRPWTTTNYLWGTVAFLVIFLLTALLAR